ncbi:hypothetical protein BC938DRAFT_474172 [Jimgerdemannia flammicorona]|uniref:Uncharacterized protein n=1 Tax=Jimgerdemannia flammicorona TaxID=994334 RepID=A0A433Q2P6_9FUNG|nr:hypothetical protein BC938DRAFT_474172 [Jimgerdemannia flammicorona]
MFPRAPATPTTTARAVLGLCPTISPRTSNHTYTTTPRPLTSYPYCCCGRVELGVDFGNHFQAAIQQRRGRYRPYQLKSMVPLDSDHRDNSHNDGEEEEGAEVEGERRRRWMMKRTWWNGRYGARCCDEGSPDCLNTSD